MSREIKLKIKKYEIVILLLLYIAAAIYLLYFSPVCGRTITRRLIQPIPFKTVIDQFKMRFGMDIFIGNMIGNILVLLPAGFFIAILGWKTKLKKCIILFFIIAAGIEIIQFIFAVGCMDIDDIWMNALGGISGFKLGSRITES